MRISDWSSDVCSSDLILQRHARRLHEKAHEAQTHPMLLFEEVLIFGARLHDGAHVDIVEGGEQRRVFLRALQALCDRLTQAGHAHALFLAGGSGGRSEEPTSELQSLMRISSAV